MIFTYEGFEVKAEAARPGATFTAQNLTRGAFNALRDLAACAIDPAREAAARLLRSHGAGWQGTVTITDYRSVAAEKRHATCVLAVGVRHIKTHVDHTEYAWPDRAA